MPEGLLRYLLYADAVAIQCALAVMLGALASVFWLRRGTSPWARVVTRKSRLTFAFGILFAVAASLVMLWLQSAVMSDGSFAEAGPMVPMMLKETHFGHAWLVGIAALLAAGIAATLRGTRALCLAALGTSAFALTRSVVSHAGAQGDFSLKVGVDWLHLMLTSLWVGMVLMGVFVALRQTTRIRAEQNDAARWIASLSQAATAGLVGILLTGALKAWWATPSLGELTASAYGSVLLVKVLLVEGAIALGGFNRFRVMPGLLRGMHSSNPPSSQLRKRFAYILAVEAAVLLCAVTAAAVLSATPTPGEG